jgi:hypothetical protein
MHPYAAARASAPPARIDMTSGGRDLTVSPNDTTYIDDVKRDQQLDALAAVHNALPLAVGNYTVRVWTSRGLVDFTYDATDTNPAVHIDAVEPNGSIALCGLSRCQTRLNACTRLLALETLVLGLATQDDDEEDLPRLPVPVIATVQLDHPMHGTISLFSAW